MNCKCGMNQWSREETYLLKNDGPYVVVQVYCVLCSYRLDKVIVENKFGKQGDEEKKSK